MAFQPVPNTLQVEFVYQVDGQIVENVRHYKFTDPTITDITAFVEALNAFMRTELMPLLSNTISLLRLVATMLDVADGLFYLSTTSLPAAGGDTTDRNLPNNVAFCVQLVTGNRGRSARGRFFIPGLADRRVGPSELDGAYVSALTDAVEGLMLVGVDDGWTPVVVSRKSGGVERAEGVTFQINSVSATDPVVDSQRRRLPGRGT